MRNKTYKFNAGVIISLVLAVFFLRAGMHALGAHHDTAAAVWLTLGIFSCANPIELSWEWKR